MSKKLVTIVVPIFNEIAMVDEIYSRIHGTIEKIEKYDFEIVFFDDGSTDGTREALEELSSEHPEVKCVFYSKNFGYLKSTFYCMQQAKGDCAIIIHADLQNPPEVIPEFLEKWEKGARIVQGVKNQSHENKIIYLLRTIFYYLLIKFFGLKLTAHATEFELFDKSFIDILKRIKTNNPFLRGFIGEYGTKIDYVYYTQDARKKGKSKFNANKYYDFALCGITQFSRNLPRKVIFVCVLAILAIIAEFCFVFLPNMLDGSIIDISNSLILRCMFMALCLFIILVSIILEYVITLIDNAVEKPLIVEEKRINY